MCQQPPRLLLRSLPQTSSLLLPLPLQEDALAAPPCLLPRSVRTIACMPLLLHADLASMSFGFMHTQGFEPCWILTVMHGAC